MTTSAPALSARWNAFGPHLTDEMGRLIDILLGQRGNCAQRPHTSRPHRLLHLLARHVRGNRCEAEMQSVLARNLADHGERFREMRRCARRSCGADQQRHVDRARAEQHRLEIAARHRVARRELARAEVIRSRVDRAHVGADKVGLPLETRLECGFRNAVAELPRRAKHAQRLEPALAGYLVAQPLDCAHSSTPRSGPCCCAP